MGRNDMEDMKRLLEELEKENRRLREKEEKQNLGREVLNYLRTEVADRHANNQVLKALEDVKNELYEFERLFDPGSQQRKIWRVEALRDEIKSCAVVRNVAGAVNVGATVLQICSLANPVAFVLAGLVNASGFFLRMGTEQDIENAMKQIKYIFETDKECFRSLTRAVENLDKVWREKFSFSIHSEKFREICRESEDLNIRNSALRDILIWFGADEKWSKINIAVSSHYLLKIVGIIGAISSSQIALGLLGVCHLYLLINGIIEDRSRMAIIDEGLKRMNEQYSVMQQLMSK